MPIVLGLTDPQVAAICLIPGVVIAWLFIWMTEVRTVRIEEKLDRLIRDLEAERRRAEELRQKHAARSW